MNDSRLPSTSRHTDAKRTAPQESAERSFKRHKTAKACITCRQQKTRCEYASSTGEELLRCNRCIRFNVECSFQQEPPPSTVPSSNMSSSHEIAAPLAHSSSFPNEAMVASGSRNSHSEPQSSVPSPVLSTVKLHTNSISATDLPDRGKLLEYPIAPFSPPRPVEKLRAPLQTDSASSSQTTRKIFIDSEPSISPLAYVWELMGAVKPLSHDKPPLQDDLVSMGVVSAEDAAVLSQIWINRYDPWLFGKNSVGEQHPDASESHYTSAFLQATQWTLASRHLTDVPPPTLSDPNAVPKPHYEPLKRRLHRTLHRKLMRAMLCQDLSLAALRALGILGIWPSAFVMEFEKGDDLYDPDDNEPASAIDPELLNMAMLKIANMMHLEQDVEKATEFGGPEVIKTPEQLQVLERARMAFKIAVGSVMFHISKGRVSSPLVPLELAEKVFGSPGVLSNIAGRGNDARLVFQCNVQAVILKLADLTFIDEQQHLPSIVTEWMENINKELLSIDHLHQALSSASVLADSSEYVAMSTLTFQVHFLRINIFFRIFMKLRRAFPRDAPANNKMADSAPETQYPPPFRRLIRTSPHLGNHPVVGQFVRETGLRMWICVEAFMAATIALGRRQDDTNVPGDGVDSPLGCAPDYLSYAMLMGPVIACALHTSTMAHTDGQLKGADMVKSLLDRICRLFRTAGVTASSPTSKTLGIPLSSSSNSRLINPTARRCADVVQMLISIWDAKTAECLARVEKEKIATLNSQARAAQNSPYPALGSSQQTQRPSYQLSSSSSHVTESRSSDGSRLSTPSISHHPTSAPQSVFSDMSPSNTSSLPPNIASLEFGDLSHIFGINFDLDPTSFYDSSIFDGSLLDEPGSWGGGSGS